MAALDCAVECFRPLVRSSTWDYCILWEFGDDPSSFIQWRGCCCSGGNDKFLDVKGENDSEHQYLVVQCKDKFVKHTTRTKACERLCKFPSSIPLYSGIHGEVVLSDQPRWVFEKAKSSASNNAGGTQVLVPLEGGLVELFSTKQIPKNQQIIDFIFTQYFSAQKETMAAKSRTNLNNGEPGYKPFLDECLVNSQSSLRDPSFVSKLQIGSNSGFHPSLEGSSTSSNLPKEYNLLTLGSGGSVSCTTSPEKSSGRYPKNMNSTRNRDETCASFDADQNEKLKSRKNAEREPYHSKNLITERNRRNRIKHGLLTLRSVVPKITKMDKAATLGDACDYIEELQETVKMYEDELRDLEEECENYNVGQEKERKSTADRPAIQKDHKGSDSSQDDRKHAKVGIEVSQIGESDFLVKIICAQRHGGFTRLMQAMNSSGLQVIDANVSTLNGLVLNIFKAEALSKETQPQTLKDSLMELLRGEGKKRQGSPR